MSSTDQMFNILKQLNKLIHLVFAQNITERVIYLRRLKSKS